MKRSQLYASINLILKCLHSPVTVTAEIEKEVIHMFIVILKTHFILLTFFQVYGFSGSLFLSILLPSWRDPPPAVHRTGRANHLVPLSGNVQIRP